MKQPINKNTGIKPKKKKPIKEKYLNYGTSKLEVYFMENFLDKLGMEYVYQYEVKSIGRVFDYYFPKCLVILELDGNWWHFNPLTNKKSPNRMQKKSMRVDELKNKWALANGIVLLRVWEKDVYEKPKEVMDMLIKRIGLEHEKQIINESKKDGSFYINKNKPNN